jgi:hypothetical protein
LIDLSAVDGLGALLQLGQLEVLDVVLTEVANDPRVPDLSALGVRIIGVEDNWVLEAQRYKTSALSLQDALNIVYAKAQGCTVLSNDGPLRKACVLHQVAVHGSLWVVLELHRLRICPAVQLCRWLHDWVSTHKARLPKKELELVRQNLGCQ